MERPKQRSTIRDVARHAGVAASTVSRVIRGGYASPITRSRVHEAVHDLNYRPNTTMRESRALSSRMVGLLVPDITNPVFASIAKGVEEVLGPESSHLLVATSAWARLQERQGILGLAARRIDGLIVSLCDDTDLPTSMLLQSLGVPVVLLDRELPQDNHDAVLFDHRAGMQQAVRYLTDLGHRRIGLICGPLAVRPGRERLTAYREALEAQGVPYQPEMVRMGGFSDVFGRSAGIDLLRASPRPTAIIAAGNRLGVGLLEVLRANGVRLGQDLSFIAYDDADVFRLNDPSITVIDRDAHEMGQTAGHILLERLWSKGKRSQKVMITTEFIVRQSCRRVTSEN